MRKRYGDQVAGKRAWRHLRNRLKFYDMSMPKTACIQESGGVVAWSSDIAADPHVLCMPSGPFRKSVARMANRYFDGMTGTVTVGPLQLAPAPASSSTR